MTCVLCGRTGQQIYTESATCCAMEECAPIVLARLRALEARIEELEVALREIACNDSHGRNDHDGCCCTARRALVQNGGE